MSSPGEALPASGSTLVGGHSLRGNRKYGHLHGRWQERSKDPVTDDFVAHKLSCELATERYGEEAHRSVYSEVFGIHGKDSLQGVHWHLLTVAQKKACIVSQLFLKEKYMSTGDFENLKARLVAGGHLQDKDSYARDETSAPTISLTTVNLIANVAAFVG